MAKGRRLGTTPRLACAAALLCWVVLAAWGTVVLRAAHVRFDRGNSGPGLPEEVANRVQWTLAWPQHVAELSVLLALAAVCLIVLRTTRTAWWTVLFVASLLGAIVWFLGQGTLDVGPARPWASPVLVHGLTWGSGAVIVTLAVASYLAVRRRPDPLPPEYDRYTLGAAGLPFNRPDGTER